MNPVSVAGRVLFVSCALLALSGIAVAETSAEALKRQIQERSAKIKEFRALLNDPDQTVRLAALDVMLKSEDLAMRELAYGVGFSSADDAMRAVCLRNKLADLTTVAIKIADISSATDQQKKALTDWGGVYTFELKSYDEKSGQFATAGSYKKGKGQVTGTGIEFAQNYCTGSFTLGEGAELVGELGCKGGWGGTYPGSIRLQ